MAGVIVQLGGQTPLGLARALAAEGVPIVGTSPDAIELAEDRGAFGALLGTVGLLAPKHGTATSYDGAKRIADDIGYPVLVRPSFVLGGAGMEIVYDDDALRGYIERADPDLPLHPVLVDRFLDDAVEIDVDALYDGKDLFLGGDHGAHRGGRRALRRLVVHAAADHPRASRTSRDCATSTRAIAEAVGVRGLINIQFAIAADVLYVLEANPRASRTVPFVSKATATPLAKAAARIMLGATIAELRARAAAARRR